MDRRGLVRRLGVVIVAGAAGCTGDGGSGSPTPQRTPTTTATGGPGDAETETRTDAPTETETSTESGSPTETEAGTATDARTGTDTPPETDSETSTETPTPTPAPDHTVVVGPDATFQFDPDQLSIEAGETVEWVWDSSNHNVRPENVPDGADWSGTPGGDGETYDEGYVYRHAFTVTGEYDYYCAPHRNLGMTGSITVS